MPLAPPAAAQATNAPASAQVRAGVEAWTAGNYDAAIKAWQGPAAKGEADAMFNLGQAYKLGRGVPKDLGKAETLYSKAAKLGHIRAADNYGILLFQTGRQQAAIPWLEAAADRGEPRAMYVLGVASYNGDFAPKDWVRAYALITRAAGTGLAQAITSLATMNATIPLAQRQMGVSLASELEQKAADARNRELAAADLGSTSAGPARPTPPMPAPPPPPRTTRPLPGALERVDLPPSALPANAGGSSGTDTGTAGADYADPVTIPQPTRSLPAASQPKPVPPKPAAPKPPAPKPAAAKPAAETGNWRVQLGAFGQKSNADALWARVRGRAELAGHPRIDIGSSVTRMLAGGFSQAGAQRACAALKAGGFTCLVVSP
jgi:cell division protein FtsN